MIIPPADMKFHLHLMRAQKVDFDILSFDIALKKVQNLDQVQQKLE